MTTPKKTPDERSLARLQRARANPAEKPKSWRKSRPKVGESRKGKYEIMLDADVEMDSGDVKALEKKMAAANVKILEKHSNRFGRSFIVEGDKATIRGFKATDDHVVDTVTALPEVRMKEPVMLTDASGIACSATQTLNQLAVMDHIGGSLPTLRENKGQGAIVVVWDESFTRTGDDEYTKRPGGAPVHFPSGTSGGTHGGFVTSTCCGNRFGLASGAELGVLGFSRSNEESLAFIGQIVEAEKKKPTQDQKAIVVNMSFGYTIQSYNLDTPEELQEQKTRIQAWDSAMALLKSEYPRLAFINASGNDGEDVCDQGWPGNSTVCKDCYIWPSFGGGSDNYGVGKEPYVRVGSVHGQTAAVPSKRMYASYTNHGMCTPVYAHGLVCAYDLDNSRFSTIQGTSFASPMFAGMVALVMTKFKDMSGDDAINYLISRGDSLEQGGSFAKVDADLFSLATPPSAGGSTGSGSASSAADEAAANAQTLDAPPETQAEATQRIVMMVAVALFGIAFLFFLYKMNQPAPPRV